MYLFEYDYTNENDEADTAFASRTLHADADLTELVNAFRDFLQAAGFNYVETIVAVKSGGDQVSSN